jgi:hypothetical protein
MTTVLSSSSTSTFGIRNYGELKDAIASWLNRTTLTDQLPIFVRLAETQIRRDVRTRVQETLVTGTSTTDTIPVPDLFLDARRVIVGDKIKTYITPEEFQEYTQDTRTGDHYTIVGEAIYVVGGALSQSYSILYWKGLVSFVNDPDTNWVLLNAPEVYLWAGCREGAEFLKDYPAADRFNAKYQEALANLNGSEKNMRFSGSIMKVRLRGFTP